MDISYYLVQTGGAAAADSWIQNLEVTSGKAQAQKAFDFVYERMIQLLQAVNKRFTTTDDNDRL